MRSPSPTACLLVALLGLVAHPTPSVAQGLGSVEGVVSLRERAPRRSAPRYPGVAPVVHEVQRVPPVVFLKGPVAGIRIRPASPSPVMTQRDTAFVPAALAVPLGTTVSFPNGDPFFHNVFSYSSSARFDLGRYPRGESRNVTFDEPGVVKVYCEVHEFMRAVIVVVENPFAAVVDDEGRFRLDGIPAGTHTFVVWHPDAEPVERELRVAAGSVARLDVELR